MCIDSFENYAYKKHEGQMYGVLEYKTHLQHVLDLLLLETYKSSKLSLIDLIYVGLGHDLIEDTTATLCDIEELSNSNSAAAISLISDPLALNRKERKVLAYAAFNACDDEYIKRLAATVKVADRLANVQFSLRDYLDSGKAKKLKMYVLEHDDFMMTYSEYCENAEIIKKMTEIIQKAKELTL